MRSSLSVPLRLTFAMAALLAAARPGSAGTTTNWQLQLDAPCIASPAVAPNGTVYLLEAGCSDSLMAVNPNGTTNWHVDLCNNNSGALAIGLDGTVYAAGQNATGRDCLFAISPVDGSTLWTFPFNGTNQTIGSAPAIGSDGTVYICYLSKVLAITNGAVAWTYPTNITFGTVFQYSSPTLAADGTIYVFGNDANFYALNPDGSVKWITPAPGAVFVSQPSPIIGLDGTIYCGDTGYFFAMNPNGTFQWTNSLPDQDFQLEAQLGSDGTIYVESELIALGGPTTNTLYAFRPDGSTRWTFPMVEDGSFYQSYLPFQASSCAVASSGQIYVVDTFGTLYSLTPNGNTNWTYTTGANGLKAPVLGPDGTLYVVRDTPNVFPFSGPYSLYSLRGTNPVACSAWPEHRKNGRNTAALAPASISAAAMQTNGLRLTVSGLTNLPACVCASANVFTNPVAWTNIGSTVLSGGSTNFTDKAATNLQSRFYRVYPQ